VKFREQDGSGSGTTRAVPRRARLGERRAAPAVGTVYVQLILVDEEPSPLEQCDPILGRADDLPSLVLVLTGRNADQQAALLREHAAELA
jgi:hypothetical protein